MTTTWELHEMDCRLAMGMLMDADSVDSIVCDPPYGLSKEPDMAEVLTHWLAGDDYTHSGSGFMGKSWDSFVPGPSVWREAYRVLKPGGHLVAFFGTRTYDLGVLALRLAGFEIRDQLAWVFGSGFPKSHDVSKGIDKRGGHPTLTMEVAEALKIARKSRGITKTDADKMFCGGSTLYSWYEGRPAGIQLPTSEYMRKIAETWPELEKFVGLTMEAERAVIGSIAGGKLAVAPGQDNDRSARTLDVTAPATPEAAQWQGWGTALKPAYEPIVLARKPLVGTVARNVSTHGTGAINIDGCRVAASAGDYDHPGNSGIADKRTVYGNQSAPSAGGRWPANLAHDGSPEVLAEFPVTSSGKMKAGTIDRGKAAGTLGTFGGRTTDSDMPGDSGSAARFFYCAKASKSDRNEGLDDLPEQPSAASEFRPNHTEGAAAGEDGNPYGRWSPVRNNHATVKPTALMCWLVRLVTPPGGTVLDPFTGSGSTGVACAREGFSFIGCEMTAEYVPIIRGRVGYAYDKAGS